MPVESTVVRYHDGNQWRVGLCFKVKVLHIVGNDGSQVRHHTRPLTEARPLTILDKPTVRQAKARLRRQGKIFGCTKAAAQWLKPTPAKKVMP